MTDPTPSCPLCERPTDREPLGDAIGVRCESCGPYSGTAAALAEAAALDEGDRANVSAWIRHRGTRGLTEPILVADGAERRLGGRDAFRLGDVLAEVAARGINVRLDDMLLAFASMCEPGGQIKFGGKDLPIFYAHSQLQCDYYLDCLETRGVVERTAYGHRITANGWAQVGALEKRRPDARQAFVAMAFADDLFPAWDEGLRPGIEAAGYRPLRLDQSEYNEKICDRITVEIERSALVVADVTLHNPGVYFEAGFALGNGIPVIWSCREDQVERCHFDTRQYNHVVWSRPHDLADRLRYRILATMPSALPDS